MEASVEVTSAASSTTSVEVSVEAFDGGASIESFRGSFWDFRSMEAFMEAMEASMEEVEASTEAFMNFHAKKQVQETG